VFAGVIGSPDRTPVINSLNLTDRSCLPIPDTSNNTLGSVLYDCSYDPYTHLSTIIVVWWHASFGGYTSVNPTCNLTSTYYNNGGGINGANSWLQVNGFVEGACISLHPGLVGFTNIQALNNPLFARINCTMMIPTYKQTRQVNLTPQPATVPQSTVSTATSTASASSSSSSPSSSTQPAPNVPSSSSSPSVLVSSSSASKFSSTGSSNSLVTSSSPVNTRPTFMIAGALLLGLVITMLLV
jgi:hypothetical protein